MLLKALSRNSRFYFDFFLTKIRQYHLFKAFISFLEHYQLLILSFNSIQDQQLSLVLFIQVLCYLSFGLNNLLPYLTINLFHVQPLLLLLYFSQCYQHIYAVVHSSLDSPPLFFLAVAIHFMLLGSFTELGEDFGRYLSACKPLFFLILTFQDLKDEGTDQSQPFSIEGSPVLFGIIFSNVFGGRCERKISFLFFWFSRCLVPLLPFFLVFLLLLITFSHHFLFYFDVPLLRYRFATHLERQFDVISAFSGVLRGQTQRLWLSCVDDGRFGCRRGVGAQRHEVIGGNRIVADEFIGVLHDIAKIYITFMRIRSFHAYREIC